MKNIREKYFGYDQRPTDPLIVVACKQLDALDIEYDINYFPGECSFLKQSTTIKFKEPQDDDFLKTKIKTDDIEPQNINGFKHVVVIDSDSDFMVCDNWLEKNVGTFNESWSAGTHYSLVNTYYFVDDVDAVHFKLMWL